MTSLYTAAGVLLSAPAGVLPLVDDEGRPISWLKREPVLAYVLNRWAAEALSLEEAASSKG